MPVIEHEISGASGSGDRSGEGRVPRPRRQTRSFALGCLAVLLVVGGVFWRQVAILWCWSVARASDAPDVIAWNCAALADLGPAALPALSRLVESPELQRAWSARTAVDLLHAHDREANAPIHDLLLHPSGAVRAFAGSVLVAAADHDASGLPAALEGLESREANVRFFSAYYLCAFPGDRFEKEVPEAPKVFQRMIRALQEGLTDPRRLLMHGPKRGVNVDGNWHTVDELAKAALRRLDPELANKGTVEAALAAEDPAAVLRAARERRSDFFK